MKVNFEKALCCDVVTYAYENKEYPKAVIYQQGKTYQISIPQNVESDKIKQYIGKYVNVTADLLQYDGKNKFKLISIGNC